MYSRKAKDVLPSSKFLFYRKYALAILAYIFCIAVHFGRTYIGLSEQGKLFQAAMQFKRQQVAWITSFNDQCWLKDRIDVQGANLACNVHVTQLKAQV